MALPKADTEGDVLRLSANVRNRFEMFGACGGCDIEIVGG